MTPRGLLIVAELALLGIILAFVEDTGLRTALGVILGLLLVRNALQPGVAGEDGPPPGLPDRREDHLFRHRLDVLFKKLREFHTLCRGVQDGQIPVTTAERRMEDSEREISRLLKQALDHPKPTEVLRRERKKRRSTERGGPTMRGGAEDQYGGESAD